MKIQVIKSGAKKAMSNHVCPWYVDEPPAARK